MQFGKMLMAGAAAFAMVLGTVGCATDDEGIEMFRIKNGEGVHGGRGGAGGAGGLGGEAELEGGLGGGAGGAGDTGVSEWGKNTGLSPYDDFGTPIAGLSFQPVYFRFDQSSIDSNEAAKLDQVASYLKSINT